VTFFVSFRSGGTGRGVADPFFLVGSPTPGNVALRAATEGEVAAAVVSKHILFGTHGFNTSFADGAWQMAAFDTALALPSSATFMGVLWPGDFWIPYINYPFEGSDARKCGARLAALCNGRFSGAASFSFVSHSLGGRLALEAVKQLNRKARVVCLMAAAVDDDVLTGQYKTALSHAEHVYVLSSVRDNVLKLAYPAGDFLSDIFGDGDSPFRGALGLHGPRPGAGASVDDNRIAKLPPVPNCDHMDYMPGGAQWTNVHPYIRRSFDRQPHSWPV
jgi:hypothetical protein